MSADRTDRQQAQVGHRGAKQVGSVPWCYQTVRLLQSLTGSLDADWNRVNAVVAELRQARAWEKIPPERPYGSLDAMVKAETGHYLASIEKKIREYEKINALQVNGTNRHTTTSRGNNITPRRGTSPEYAVARLARDRPDLHARVLAGELTPHAAAVAAGFRHRKISVPIDDLPALAAVLRRRLTTDEVRSLAEALVEEL